MSTLVQFVKKKKTHTKAHRHYNSNPVYNQENGTRKLQAMHGIRR
jgi:hypothetical protein